ncbi:hypothetical protein ACJX0J_005980, partial [Zea mays]
MKYQVPNRDEKNRALYSIETIMKNMKVLEDLGEEVLGAEYPYLSQIARYQILHLSNCNFMEYSTPSSLTNYYYYVYLVSGLQGIGHRLSFPNILVSTLKVHTCQLILMPLQAQCPLLLLQEVPNELGNQIFVQWTKGIFKIATIPQEIGTLANMQRLVLAGNLIEIIPANIGYLQNLKILTLDRNRISILPEELGSLSNLQQLSVPQNFLLCLPKSIGDLRNMSVLNVSDNKLKELPESIGGCSSLEEFQANGNAIEDVPASICNLVCLKSLSLNGNKIRQLPQNLLKDCTALQSLSLHDNPITMDQFQQ